MLSLNAPVISLSMQNISTANWWVKISKNPENDCINFISLGIAFYLIMSLNKSILIFCFSGLLSFQQDDPKETIIVAYREPEMMYGKVQLLIERRTHKRVIGYMAHTVAEDTSFFDRDGDPIETRVGNGNDSSLLEITYETKHDVRGRRLETTIYDNGGRSVCKYDSNGYAIKWENYNNAQNSTQPVSYTIFTHNAVGEITELVTYGYPGNAVVKEEREYSSDGLLLNKNFDGGQFKEHNQYISRDKKGNWTKKVNIVLRNNLPYSRDTIKRKITYY